MINVSRKILWVVLLLFSSVASALTIDKIVVFGDSLTDTGNFYAITKNIPKSPPYYEGRFSDGPVWVEVLAEALHLPPKALANYALGGSWAEPFINSGEIFPYDLAKQVDYYLDDAIKENLTNHLFVFWIGANDYLRGRDFVEYATSNTVYHIEKQIDRLISQGARNFLILNLPSLGLTPFALKMGDDFIEKENILSEKHNTKLDEMVKQKRVAFPDYKFVLFDISYPFMQMITNPEAYHLKDVTHACLSDNALKKRFPERINNINLQKNLALRVTYQAGLTESTCPNPQEFLFWDHVHPTEVGHRILGAAILEDLGRNDIHGVA